MANIATLHEIETYWSIDDLADANEALDVQQDMIEAQLAEARRARG